MFEFFNVNTCTFIDLSDDSTKIVGGHSASRQLY